MNRLQLLIVVILGLVCVNCQKDNDNLKTAKEFFPKERAKVLVVGTFHFDYPDSDAHKTNEKDKLDVLKEPKKSELKELIDYIKSFQPNKIAIEADSSWLATQKYQKFKNGELRNDRDERVQLGMRIAHELSIDTLYAIDAWSMAQDIQKRDSVYTNELWKDYDLIGNSSEEAGAKNWLKYEDSLKNKISLLEYFKRMNSAEFHKYGYGIYLQGDFKLGQYKGADIISYWWYNRNARIFRNLQEVITSTNDRVLVIFGNGHAPLLRHLISSSPEMEFVEFDNLRYP